MIDPTLLALFIPTFFVVSITPGMCMTLAMTLGMSIGVRRAMWMMWGELLGVATVSVSAVIGVSAVMLANPQLFQILKWLGAGYLAYVALGMWNNTGKLALDLNNQQQVITNKFPLFSQGFVTAVANPKGWAFTISLLPPFINPSLALAPQLLALIAIILVSEFICMMLYASGGKTVAKILIAKDNVQLMNKVSGGLMLLVALWLALG